MRNLKVLLNKLQQKIRWKSIEFQSIINFNNTHYTTAPGRRIFLYHGIDFIGRTDLNSRFVSVKEFERHLNWIKGYCHAVTMDEYFTGELHSEKLTVAIAFDDGYKNNFSLALPLLEKYKIPATFFVTAAASKNVEILWPDLLDVGGFITRKVLDYQGEKYTYAIGKGYVGKSKGRNLKTCLREADFNTISDFIRNAGELKSFMNSGDLKIYWELMSTEDIAIASKSPVISIGSHGASHLSLNYIAEESMLDELKSSKLWLEQVTHKPVNSFAFPFGDYTPEIVEKARSVGYNNICCAEYRYSEASTNSAYHDRMGVNPYIAFPVQIAEWKRGSYD